MNDTEITQILAEKVMGMTDVPEWWQPLTEAYCSKMLREKLAELGWRRQELKRSWIEPTVYTFVIERREPKHASGYETTIGPYANTEELAVAKAALLTVGVEGVTDPTQPNPNREEREVASVLGQRDDLSMKLMEQKITSDVLLAALKTARAALIAVEQHAPGYDWNADPLSLTLITGAAYEEIDNAIKRADPTDKL